MTKETGERHGKQSRDADRRARLAQALRANLQKRKAQARVRVALARRRPADDEQSEGDH
jgi:hypothetical protein